MPFYNVNELHEIPLVNGITLAAVYGEKISVSFLNLPPLSRLPIHHHANEQVGIVLDGEIEYTIGEETRVCGKGMAFVIPPNVPHSLVVVSERAAKLADIFTPPRKITEPLKYLEEQKE
jgi:quercetin dioxygenase-like cupin family protein